MIKAILFDLDGTLVDRGASLATFLKGQYTRCLSQSGSVDYAAFRARF